MRSYPKWAAEAVWYEIFPDRFCRINSECPISASDLEGTTPWSLNGSNPWEIHPWTSNWYERQPYERLNGRPLKENILRRRFCGDINGIISKLGYLSDLGVNALYASCCSSEETIRFYRAMGFEPLTISSILRRLSCAIRSNWAKCSRPAAFFAAFSARSLASASLSCSRAS